MSITIGAFLVPYLLFLALFVVGGVVNIYHMVKFGTYTLPNYIALVIFLGGAAVMIWGTIALLAGVEWATPLLTIGSDPTTTSFQ
jgi:hypothetical protein